MKDLYKHLKLDPTATREEIAATLDGLPELKAAAGILLDPDKKESYDRAYATLKMIASLRFRLDLDKSDSWFIRKYPDFAIMPKPRLSESAAQEPPEPEPPVGQQRRGRRGQSRYAWLLPIVILLIIVAAVGLMVLL